MVSGRKKIKIIKPKIEWRRLRLIPAFWRALFCFFLLAFYFYCRPPEIKESFLFFPFPAVISLKMKYGKNNAGRSREAAKDERRSGGRIINGAAKNEKKIAKEKGNRRK